MRSGDDTESSYCWVPFCGDLCRRRGCDESIRFNKYHDNQEINQHLKWIAETYPNLVTLEEAGKSFLGAPIWALSLTNKATGEPEHKPGMYVDGNTHAGEVAGAEACL